MLKFSELDSVVADGFFSDALQMDAANGSYTAFIDLYSGIEPVASDCEAKEAFFLRTMLIHDLRRIRLSGPDFPTPLLPSDWSGAKAESLAASLYSTLSERASPWLSEVLDTDYPAVFTERFP